MRGAATPTETRVTLIDYWPTVQLQKIREPDGSSITYIYDAAQRLTDIEDNAGNSIHYDLDNAGNRLREDTADTNGSLRLTLSRFYNALGPSSMTRSTGWPAPCRMPVASMPKSRAATTRWTRSPRSPTPRA